MDRQPLTAARRSLGSIVERARHHPVTLTDHGQDAVVIVSAAEYQRLRGLDEEHIKRRLLARAEEHRAGRATPGLAFDEAMSDLGLPELSAAYRALHEQG